MGHQLKNLAGQRFGHWYVIKRASDYVTPAGNSFTRWECICDCGNKRDVNAGSLLAGTSTNCGCAKNEGRAHLNLTGERFGRLLVLKEAKRKKVKGKHPTKLRQWKCRCDCGKETMVISGSLRSGNTTRCSVWCLCDWGQAALNTLYRNYQKSARKRRLTFALDKEVFQMLTESNCVYCGIQPLQYCYSNNKRQNGPYIYNGIDRLDSSKGYTLDNVVPACEHCNKSKRDLPLKDFVNYLTRFGINPELLKEKIRIQLAIQQGRQLFPIEWEQAHLIDIDGTILKHMALADYKKATPLPGAIERVNMLYERGDYVMFWSARPQSLRHFTRWQLTEYGFKFHALAQQSKVYCHNIHIWDDNPITIHPVTRDKGIGLCQES